MFDSDLGPPLAREAYRSQRTLPSRDIDCHTVRVRIFQMAQYAAVDFMWKLLEHLSRQPIGFALFLSGSRPPQRRDSLGAICFPSCLRQCGSVIERVVPLLSRRTIRAGCVLGQCLLHDVDPLLPSRHEVAVISDDLGEDVWFHFGLPDVVSAAANRYPTAATSRQANGRLKHHSLTCWQSPRRFLQSLKALVHASGNLMIGEHAAGL